MRLTNCLTSLHEHQVSTQSEEQSKQQMFRLFWKIGLNAVNVDFPNNRSSLYNPNKLQKSYRFSPPFFHTLGQVIDKLRSVQASQKIFYR